MMRTEVREEQRVRIPREDLLLARAPRLEVDVGRRGRGHHVAAGAAADARGVADERHARRRVEIRDVMGRVTGRVLDLRSRARRPSASRRPRPTRRCLHRHGLHVAPQPIHVLRVEPSGAGQELRPDRPGAARRGRGRRRRCAGCFSRIDPTDPEWSRWMCVTRICRTSSKRMPLRVSADVSCAMRGRRPRVDERDAGGAVQDRRRDDLRPAEEVEVDVVEAGGE